MIDFLKSIFIYSPDKPLLFTQFYFWGFFTIVFAVYAYIHNKKALRNLYLFAISLFFYYKTSGIFVIILLFTTTVDFYLGNFIYNSASQNRKKWLIALSVFINLTILFYFKYTGFITETINNLLGTNFHIVNYFSLAANSVLGTDFIVDKIILPVGISFFTFQSISYSIDIYMGKIKPVNRLVDFGFFVSFFPQLVAGPIVRASEFIPQIYNDYKLSKAEFGLALYLILKGLVKKMFISDYISLNFVDRVFEAPLKYTGFENLMALYGYSLQVYADFSGYTDIAIGVALLMGYRLSENFNSPYKAKSTSEFWKRWHISLSTWLKDYLYIPLGGNREGTFATYTLIGVIGIILVLLSGWLWLFIILAAIAILFVVLAYLFPSVKNTINTNINLLITMILGGLWHGSTWMFVIWGGLNGVGLIISKFWKKETQVFRWIIFIAINVTVFALYISKYWTSENGKIIWILLNAIWIYSYAVWISRVKNFSFKILLIRLLELVLVIFFTIVILTFSGLWFKPEKLIYGLLIISVFYLFNFIFKKYNFREITGFILIFTTITAIIYLLFVNSGISAILAAILIFVILLSYLYRKVKLEQNGKMYLPYFWGIFLTFNFITFTRIWFRGQTLEITNNILYKIGNDWNISLIPTMIASYKTIFITMAIGYFIHWVSNNFKLKYVDWFSNAHFIIKIAIVVILVFFIYQVKTSDLQPFIYFQF